MYYVLLAILAVILFFLRKRILGGIVGVVTLVLIIGLTIFMLDFFFLGKDRSGEVRDVRNVEMVQPVVEEYDEVVKDPVQKAKDLGDSTVSAGQEVNDKLQEAGSALDERLGIQKDSKNNNVWGSDTEGEQVSEDTQDSEQSSGKDSDDSGSSSDNTEVKEDKNMESKNRISFEDLGFAESQWGLSKEDASFVESASPFNLGKFSNGSITILVEKEGVSIIE